MADDRTCMLTLAKVLIASAWADGEITIEEQNCLKDIIFHLSAPNVQLSAQEWEMLEMYIEAPVGADERARLVADLQDAIQSPAEREYVLNALQQMALADGVSGTDEQQVINEISEAVRQTDVGILDGLNRLLGRSLSRRSAAVAQAPNRDAYFDDYLKNKVYYETNRILQEEGRSLDLSDAELRKLGLAGGLMARIAKVDEVVSESEFETMVQIIADIWEVDKDTAVFIANVAVSSLGLTYDYYRMTREFATSTTLEERRRFLVALFLIAGVDDGVSFDETEEIRLVQQGLNVTHEEFINAKLRAKELRG
ncbi:MAG: TerB family tellurite resistance protein [Candidatus Promineifilaceae bacterium]